MRSAVAAAVAAGDVRGDRAARGGLGKRLRVVAATLAVGGWPAVAQAAVGDAARSAPSALALVADGGGSAELAGGAGRVGGFGGPQEAGNADPGGRVLRVEASADARATGAARVAMNYRLELGRRTGVVPFTLLRFAPTAVGEISARANGKALPVDVRDRDALRLEGGIELPAEIAGPGRLSLELDYRVEGAVREEGGGARVVLPMLAVDWPPAEALPGMFQAEVALPEGTEAREIFPVTPSGAATPGVARASLQVVPAVVRARAMPAGSAGLSLPGILELLVLLVVVASGMAGLRHMRRAR